MLSDRAAASHRVFGEDSEPHSAFPKGSLCAPSVCSEPLWLLRPPMPETLDQEHWQVRSDPA